MIPIYPSIHSRLPPSLPPSLLPSFSLQEILHLLESPESLDEKVQEAIKVLQEFQTHVKDGSE